MNKWVIANFKLYKTAEEIFSLMSIIFKAAMAHGIINKNPLAIVYHEKHERKHGKSLTKKEENLISTNRCSSNCSKK